MAFPTPELVVSGVPYAVLLVNDRIPTGAADFVGVVAVTIEGSSGRHVIRGDGAPRGGGARLYEKSEDGLGKDIRTWQIDPREEPAGFTATAD